MGELSRPTAEGAGIGGGLELGVLKAPAVEMQQPPGAGGQLGKRVDGAQGGEVGIGGDDLAPQGVLLGGVEQQPGFRAVQQKLRPKAFKPGLERQDAGRIPAGLSSIPLGSVERETKGAGSALVGGQDQCAATKGLRNGGRHAGRRTGGASSLHNPVIRRVESEIRVRIRLAKASATKLRPRHFGYVQCDEINAWLPACAMQPVSSSNESCAVDARDSAGGDNGRMQGWLAG